MGIQVIYIGKQSKNLYVDPEKEFIKRLKRYCNLDLIAIPANKKFKSLPKDELLKNEAQQILSRMKDSSYLILLDENGSQYNSRSFAKNLQGLQNHNTNICFVIGGAYGFSDLIKDRSDEKISLSKMTLPHHLARVVFLEQLYRAFSILNNEPYHND